MEPEAPRSSDLRYWNLLLRVELIGVEVATLVIVLSLIWNRLGW